jgi:hypothetical protein
MEATMALPIQFLTLVVDKTAIRSRYPGGLPQLAVDFGPFRQDDELVGFCAMSGGDVENILERLCERGLQLGRDMALGDMMHGELESCPGVRFIRSEGPDPFPCWSAEAVDRSAA